MTVASTRAIPRYACILALTGMGVLCSCQLASHRIDVPATIVGSTLEGRNQLRLLVSSALNNVKVELSADALTETSLLTIERKLQSDMAGRIGRGREMDMPHQFRLVVRDSQCVLIHLATSKRYQLTETKCRPAK